MATLPVRNGHRQVLEHVARARELARKYEMDIAAPTSSFMPDETIEEEFDRLLNKLS